MFRFSHHLLTGLVVAAAWSLSPQQALATPAPAAAAADDTIQVRLSSGASMTLHVRDANAIKKMRPSQMDSLLATLDRYVKQAEAVGRAAGDAGRTTLEFYPARDLKNPAAPEKLRVVVYSDAQHGSSTATSTATTTTTTTVTETDDRGRRRTTDVTDVQVGGTGGVRVRVEESRTNGRDRTVVSLGETDVQVTEDNNGSVRTVRVGASLSGDERQDSIRQARRARYDRERTHSGMNLGLGLNTFTHTGAARLAGDPNGATTPVDLRTWGSRYVQLGWLWDTRLAEKVTSAPFIRYGFSFAFNNFMLSKNRVWVDDQDVTKLQIPTQEIELQKSKLATTVLNLPIVFGVKLRNAAGKEVVRLAAGGYGGYRLGARTKLKYQEDGKTRKPKEHGSYNLEDWQYGLTGAIGIYGTELFVNYNLNEVFRKDRGPQANVLSFGITLIGLDGDLRSRPR